MKIMTLCAGCAELYRASFSVKPYTLKNHKTQLNTKCDNCHKPYRAQLKLFVIDKKGR